MLVGIVQKQKGTEQEARDTQGVGWLTLEPSWEASGHPGREERGTASRRWPSRCQEDEIFVK